MAGSFFHSFQKYEQIITQYFPTDLKDWLEAMFIFILNTEGISTFPAGIQKCMPISHGLPIVLGFHIQISIFYSR